MSNVDHPSKTDIQAIFKKLRSIPSNKQCFDCNANNPTWASVTYGVFLCIDCSAVHRSLGVHLTFIRSTQLDTSWTWIQLRAMQCGGNANAMSFFHQHGCTTNDAQQKYTSRAASMYKGKLEQSAIQAMKLHGTRLHIDLHSDEKVKSPDQKEVDFFAEHTDSPALIENLAGMTLCKPSAEPIPLKNGAARDPNAGVPNVEAALSISPTEAASKMGDRKSIIGGKKPATKGGLGGAKKGGLGGSKVKADFHAIEKQAEQIDKDAQLASKLASERTKEEEEQRMSSMRLTYQDITKDAEKQDERLKKLDPKKAEQVERLGMGGIGLGNKGISHSAFSGMSTIAQESPALEPSSGILSRGPGSGSNFDRYSSGGMRSGGDFFEDETGGSFVRSGSPRGGGGNGGGSSNYLNEKKSSSSAWERDLNSWGGGSDWSTMEASNNSGRNLEDRYGRSRRNEPAPVESSNSDDAQKKFGNAKAISSDAYFGNQQDPDSRAALSRFEGSSSISSDDLFGNGQRSRQSYGGAGVSPDLGEIKEGVRQGVTKVAGKLSSLASGMVNTLQDRYGNY